MSRNESSFSTVEIDNSNVTVKRASRLSNVKIPLHSILSCSKSSKEDAVILNFTKYSSKNEMVLAKKIIQGRPDLIRTFHEEVSSKIKDSTTSRPRRLLVFINPFAGRRNAIAIFHQLKPLFDCADVICETVVLTEIGTARKHILESKELYSYDGVVSVGGDGTLNEVVSGLMIRCQLDLNLDYQHPTNEQMPCLLPIGIIPAGTYNGFAKKLHKTTDPTTAAIHIIRGNQKRSNIYSIHMDGQLITYAALYLGLGVTANALKSAEKMRCLGHKRYFLGILMMLLKSYNCSKLKLSYKKARPASTEDASCHSDQEWKTIEDEFQSVDSLLMNMEQNGSKISYNFGENCCQMILLKKCSRKNYYKFLKFLRNDKYRALNYNFVNCIKIKAVRIEIPDQLDSDDEPYTMIADGEIITMTTNQVDFRLHPRAILVFAQRE